MRISDWSSDVCSSDLVEVLKHDSDGIAPEPGEGILVETGEAGAADMDLAFARTLQAGNDHHHRGFAGARGAYTANRPAGLHDQVEAAQNVDRTRRIGQGQLDGFNRAPGGVGE